MKNQTVDPLLTEIHDLLYQLGVKATIQGFFETSSAVFLVMQDEHGLRFSIVDVYGKISKLYHVEPDVIDPRIRRVIRMIWKSCPERLSHIAGEKLETAPTPRQFLNILCRYLTDKETSVKTYKTITPTP